MNRHAHHISGTLGALTFASVVSLAALGIAGVPMDRAVVARPLVGDFTGEVAAEGPVYRLPAIEVVAGRAATLARIEREDHAVGAHVSERAPAPLVPLLPKEVV